MGQTQRASVANVLPKKGQVGAGQLVKYFAIFQPARNFHTNVLLFVFWVDFISGIDRIRFK